MEEKVIQFVKTDKELQKHIWIMHLKSDDLLASYIALGIILFPEIFLMIAIPKIFVPIVIAEMLIEIFFIPDSAKLSPPSTVQNSVNMVK